MVKNYFFNLLLTLTNLLFPIISFPYVSHILGPEGIGSVQFAFSFAQYFGLIASIGIPIYGTTAIARYHGDMQAQSKVFTELIVIYLITSALLSLLYLIVIGVFPYFQHNKHMYNIAFSMVILGFTNIDWLYAGLEQFKAIALRSVAFKILSLILIYTLIKQRNDYPIYLILLIFTYLGNNVLSIILLRGKININLAGLSLRPHFVPLLLILGTSLAASMYTDMDTVLLGFLSDNKTVGFYTAAVKFSKIALPFVTSLNVVLIPRISKNFGENNLDGVRHLLKQTFAFIMFFSVPIVFGLGILAPEFILLFSGREFLPAVQSMQILSVLPLIIGFAHLLLFLILVPSGHNKEMFACVMMGMITSVGLNFLLVPHFKHVGSSVANVSAEIVVTCCYFYFINKYFKFKYDWLLIAKSVLSAATFWPAVYFIRSLHLPVVATIVVAISVCGLLYIALQTLLFRNNFLRELIVFWKVDLKKTSV